MKLAGLLYGTDSHHLDHLAPLCSLLSIPLIVTEENLAALAKKFYPDLQVICWNIQQAPENVVKNFDCLIYSTPRVLFDEVFFFSQGFHRKRIRTIWCPHGNSDKGRNSPYMEALQEEELLLTYGPRIEHFLREKGIKAPFFRVGNYRLRYYKKHKKFYNRFFSRKPRATILYAPTWQDWENNSSFAKMWPLLVKAPKKFYLMVKLHPNLYTQYPKEIEYLEKSGVILIKDFPPIYPLLAKTDLYIGDMSSIGYDFLAFHKPMVLLAESELARVGRYVSPDELENLFEICEEEIVKIPQTQTLYEETFDVKPLDITKLTQTLFLELSKI